MTYLLGVALALGTLYYAYFTPVMRVRFANLFLGGGLAVFFLREYLGPAANDQLLTKQTHSDDLSDASMSIWADRIPYFGAFNNALCILFAVLAVATSLYLEVNFNRYLYTAPVIGYRDLDILVGATVVIITLEATRRVFGKIITGVVLASIAFALLGPMLPGIFHHSGMSVRFLIENIAVGHAGVYGFILEVGTTWVAIFLVFAGMAKIYGGMDFMRKLSVEIRNQFKTGFVIPSISASMFMGSLTGASAANVATTGSFTIPLMKDQGIDARYAGSIESLASTGGQMLPPVMGTAAFLMADILGIAYADVMIGGMLPALLFYFAVTVTVALQVYKHGWTVSETGSFDYSLLLKGGKYFGPILVIVYMMAEMRATPLTAGFYAIITLTALEFVSSIYNNRAVVRPTVEASKRTVDGLNRGIVEMVPLVGILATIGIVIEILSRTGFSQQLSTYLVSFGGGSLLVMLLIAMCASILFGMGMPTPAAYIIVAILVAPALAEIGLDPLIAHMFVFYFAMLSAITPPVALGVVVASRIADADFLATAAITLLTGIGALVVPFIFVYNPSLILWSMPGTIVEFAFAAVGIVAVAITTTGYIFGMSLSVPGRVSFFGLALTLLFYPTMPVRLVAICLLVGVLANTYLERFEVPILYQRA